MQNYLKYTNKTSGTFSEQCNLRFLSTKVIQGSVATRVNYDRISISSFTANLLQSVAVKNFENRLAFRRVTGKNKVAPFFPDTVYLANCATTKMNVNRTMNVNKTM